MQNISLGLIQPVTPFTLPRFLPANHAASTPQHRLQTAHRSEPIPIIRSTLERIRKRSLLPSQRSQSSTSTVVSKVGTFSSGIPREELLVPSEIQVAVDAIIAIAHKRIHAPIDDMHGVPDITIARINRQAIENINRLKNRCCHRAIMAIDNFHSGIDIDVRQNAIAMRAREMHRVGDEIRQLQRDRIVLPSLRPAAKRRRDEKMINLHHELGKWIDLHAASSKALDSPEALKRIRLAQAVDDFNDGVANILSGREKEHSKLRPETLLGGLSALSYVDQLFNQAKVHVNDADLDMPDSDGTGREAEAFSDEVWRRLSARNR